MLIFSLRQLLKNILIDANKSLIGGIWVNVIKKVKFLKTQALKGEISIWAQLTSSHLVPDGKAPTGSPPLFLNHQYA